MAGSDVLTTLPPTPAPLQHDASLCCGEAGGALEDCSSAVPEDDGFVVYASPLSLQPPSQHAATLLRERAACGVLAPVLAVRTDPHLPSATPDLDLEEMLRCAAAALCARQPAVQVPPTTGARKVQANRARARNLPQCAVRQRG